jgi:hypothetical protein
MTIETMLGNSDLLALKKERCERALLIRHYLHKPRSYFEKKYQIKQSSLQNWEMASLHSSGMTDYGARTLSRVYQNEGLPVTVEWLMYGIGESPIPIPSHHLPNRFDQKNNPNDIAAELKTFHQIHPHAVHHIIQDDAFSPWLMPGDYVAGSWLFESAIQKVLNYPVIANVESGEITARLLKINTKNQTYCLTCSNAQSKIPELHLTQNQLLAVAPIMWIRKIKMNSDF